MSVGVELACARRVCGLSIEDISTRPNVTVGTLAAIENNHVDDIPTVEVRGALRAYAAEVQLDPENVIHRYLAEFGAQPPVVLIPVSPCSLDAFPGITVQPRCVPIGSENRGGCRTHRHHSTERPR